MPEALLGGYPKGADFGARVGYRTPEGRDAFLKYWREAIEVPGPQTEALGELARNTGAALVVGAIERDTTTLYCTALFFSSGGQLVGKHRKLVPTAMERLIWGQGDGSTLFSMQTAAGRVGAAICWENYMPLLRTAMYAKGLDIWCAPTVDERDIWQTSMRHIAYEGRLFVVSACQYQPPPGSAVPDWPLDRPLIRGGSVIVSPLGEVLAGPRLQPRRTAPGDDRSRRCRARSIRPRRRRPLRPAGRLHLDRRRRLAARPLGDWSYEFLTRWV